MNVTRRDPWKVFLSCTLSLSLTACSVRSQYVWHDLGPQSRSPLSRSTAAAPRWGAESEGPEVSDPLIAPGFLLSLHSIDDGKLNGDFRVDFDGNVALPYDQTVNTTGLTLSNLEKKLTDLYRPYFKTAGGVKVHVRERRYWVDARGLVQKPGRYLVDRNTSLDQVIATAGGFDRDNPPLFVRIQKGLDTVVIDLDQYMNKGDERAQILGWVGGEVLFFQKESGETAENRMSPSGTRLPVYLLGEVRKPGEYSARSGYDFVDFLTQANGFTEAADLKRIEVIRRTRGRLNIYEFSWDELARAPTPMEGDVIIVHADRETKTERRIGLGAAILSAIASIATAYVIYDKVK